MKNWRSKLNVKNIYNSSFQNKILMYKSNKTYTESTHESVQNLKITKC